MWMLTAWKVLFPFSPSLLFDPEEGVIVKKNRLKAYCGKARLPFKLS